MDAKVYKQAEANVLEDLDGLSKLEKSYNKKRKLKKSANVGGLYAEDPYAMLGREISDKGKIVNN